MEEYRAYWIVLVMPESYKTSIHHHGFFCRFWVAALCFLLWMGALGPVAKATILIPPDFASLVSKADTILDGEVLEVNAKRIGLKGLIFTFVTLKVHEVVKGEAEGPFILRIAGGTIGDETQSVVGAPLFSVGDRALFFIRKNGKASVPIVGMMYGTYWIEKDSASGEEAVLKGDGTPLLSVAEIDEAHQRGPVAVKSYRSLAPQAANRVAAPVKLRDFKKAIRSKLK